MCKRVIMAVVAAFVAGTAMAKDRIVIVPAHPDDLIATIGFCLLAKDTFDIHVVDYTHGERGLGPEAFTNGRGVCLQGCRSHIALARRN